MGNNGDASITETDRLLLQKDEEVILNVEKLNSFNCTILKNIVFVLQIRRMQDMLQQMQEKLKASDKKHDSIIDV